MITLKEVRNYAMDLIVDGKIEYHMLDEFEKSKLTGLIMKSSSRMHIWEYIVESDFKNELPDMLADWLEKNDESNGIEVLDKLRENAILYASKEAIIILEEQLKEYNYDLKDRINHE